MKQKKSASILKKFLIINLTVFSVLGLFTIIYLEAIQPTLVKERSNNHKIVINNTKDNLERLNIEYTKEEGERVFEEDFNRTLQAAERLIGERNINYIAKEVIVNMVYQIGEGGVSKFKNMWSALDKEDYGEASFQMLDSLWAKQTPARAGKLAGKMRSAKS